MTLIEHAMQTLVGMQRKIKNMLEYRSGSFRNNLDF